MISVASKTSKSLIEQASYLHNVLGKVCQNIAGLGTASQSLEARQKLRLGIKLFRGVFYRREILLKRSPMTQNGTCYYVPPHLPQNQKGNRS